MREKINIVWFKRDLRLSDHQPLKNAFSDDLPTLLLYNFEPLMLEDAHYNARHWRFVYQSIGEINQQLTRYKATLYIFNQNMLTLLYGVKLTKLTGLSHKRAALFVAKKTVKIGTHAGNKQCRPLLLFLIGKT